MSSPFAIAAAMLIALCFCFAAKADGAMPTSVAPTSIRVVNQTQDAVYANLVLGQPPASRPPNCSNPGRQIVTLKEAGPLFISSVTRKPIKFVRQTAAASDKGYYRLQPGEVITYKPKTFACAAGICSAAMTYNFFFTPQKYEGKPNNGCGGSAVFGDATNLAEGSINFAINGAQGSGCPNADAADISAVNGINAFLKLEMKGQSWPFASAENSSFGHNANASGVYGWAATACTGNAGYPNPQNSCAAPVNAPRAKDGTCRTPDGASYAPIVDPKTGIAYCDERSDPGRSDPQGLCVSQRTGGVTGGVVNIVFRGFMPNPYAK
ncbi:MAG TPA: hypothetical protein VF798_02015 [Burkholderiaceae bacterium]